MKDGGKHEVSSSVKSSAEPVGQPTGGGEVLALLFPRQCKLLFLKLNKPIQDAGDADAPLWPNRLSGTN